ncbi:MAG: BACON domain-containing carbohydrate-binding protein [Vicinamibacteraceae bacterium]
MPSLLPFRSSFGRATRRLVPLAITLTLGLVAATPAAASTVPYRTDGDLVALASRVVYGRVLSVATETAENNRIYTVTRLAVIEDLTGVNASIIEVRELGGRIGSDEMFVAGTPGYIVGQDVLLLLERGPRGLRTVALAFSAFHVVPEGVVGAEAGVVRFAAGLEVLGDRPESRRTRTLAEMRTIVGAVKGVTPVRPAAVAAIDQAVRVEEPFTLLGSGSRWRQADSAIPVNWYRNTDRPHPLTSGNIDTEITTAAAAWTNPTTASLILAHAGTRSAGGATDVFCTSTNAGAGLISFEDPEEDAGSGVLAIGGFCASGPTTTVSGQNFWSISHGYVVFNQAASLGSTYRVAPSFTRVLTHEIGHAIGLGHPCGGTGPTCTTGMQANLMYPSCCYSTMPLPPAIGPDDLAGLEFIYPQSGPPPPPPPPPPPVCTYTVTPTSAGYGPGGGSATINVTPSASTCAWTASTNATWATLTGTAGGTGTGSLGYSVGPNTGLARTAQLTVAGTAVTITQSGDVDSDSDGLPDSYEVAFGLNPNSPSGADGASGDPDGDGRTNLQEYQAQPSTHPRGFQRRYLAEGAVNAFFSTEIAILNADPQAARTLVRIQPEGQTERTIVITVPSLTRVTLSTQTLGALTTAPFSTLIESDRPLVVDRTMSWDSSGYGSHAETAVDAPSTTWYLAEGSTSGPFSLFYLLQNPNAATVNATITFLRPAGNAPVVRSYVLPANSRTTIPVDSAAPELTSTDVSGVIAASQPIIVERAMYLDRPGQPFAAGHESAGVTAPSNNWFLAEGATGAFFEMFVLIANPNPTASTVTVDYLLTNGTVLTKAYSVAANSRFTIWVDEEQFPSLSGNRALASVSCSMRVRSTNNVPIIVERAMWWPQPNWYEAHNAPGTTVTGTRWALAGGEVGGTTGLQTFVLVANTSATAGQARVTIYFEDGTSAQSTINLLANSRTNVSIGATFPSANGRRFAIIVDSLGGIPAQLVVERSMYSNAGGVTWSAGTAAVATRLQ